MVRVGLDSFRDLLACEGYQSSHGFMQNLDVRFKLVGLGALVALAVFSRSVVFEAAVLMLCYALAHLSRIPFRRFASRTLFVAVPAFIVALPKALLSLFSVDLLGFQTFSDGLGFLLIFTLRVAAASSALILLISTTRFSTVLSCLRWFRIPRMLLWAMAMTHRYLILLSGELYRLTLGRECRVHRDLTFRDVWREGGKAIGFFMMRSLERGERVQMAALSRGGGADLKFYPPGFRVSFREAAFTLPVAALICFGLVIILW